MKKYSCLFEYVYRSTIYVSIPLKKKKTALILPCKSCRNKTWLNWIQIPYQIAVNFFSKTIKSTALFVLYNIQVDLCHFDWRIQLSKQTKHRPTISNCDITRHPFLLVRPVGVKQWLCAFCTAILRHADADSTAAFNTKDMCTQWCFSHRAIVLIGWNEKCTVNGTKNARWVT